MTTDTIVEISLDTLHESPFNPRKTFTAIDELVASIKGEGRIHSPLLVRPRIPPLFNAGPDTQPEAAAGYEIVFGHRRFRAAELAGLASAPCMVRAMSDAEARSAQIAENLARKDVHPIEEAEGFAAMLEQDGITADELATLVGKSRSYIYGRLKLLEAAPAVRAACLAGEIGSEVALLVARVGPLKLQEKALARIKAVNESLSDGGQASYRRIKAELAERFTLELKGAMFDREDATLLPGAGVCSACPKRSGNSPLFEDVAAEGFSRWGGPMHKDNGQPNRCTDPDCWEAKTNAHLARGAAKLEAEGKTVVTGNKARAAIDAHGTLKEGYVPLDKIKAELKKAGQQVTVQHVQDPRSGKVVKAVKQADLVAAGLAKAPKPGEKKAKGESNEEQRRKREEEWQRAEDQAKVTTEERRRLLQAVRTAAAGRERTEFELRLVAAAALGGVPYEDWPTIVWLYGTDMDKLKKRVDQMPAAELTQLLLDCAIVDNVRAKANYNAKPGPLLALANHYGIDAKATMQTPAPPAAEPTSTPSMAAASAKKAAKGGAARAVKGVTYRCAETGETWSGRGLRPRWLNAKIAGGASLSDFAVGDSSKSKARKVTDDAGSAGGRTVATEDLFDAAEAHA